MQYYISKTINSTFSRAVELITNALLSEGFGIISEIDMKGKFKEKLQIDFRNYKILGACNPTFAYQALTKEDKIGTMLPCNVIVQELFDGKVEIATIDPYLSIQVFEDAELQEIAKDVRNKLERAINSLY